MKRTAIIVFVTAVAVWAGSALFFSAMVLPAFFLNLPVHQAGDLAALLFPRYNALATGCALAAAACAFSLWLTGARGWRIAALVSALSLLLQVYAAFGLHPRIAALRGSGDKQTRETFDRLHHRSVRLHTLLLGAQLGLLIWCGRRVDRD